MQTKSSDDESKENNPNLDGAGEDETTLEESSKSPVNGIYDTPKKPSPISETNTDRYVD